MVWSLMICLLVFFGLFYIPFTLSRVLHIGPLSSYVLWFLICIGLYIAIEFKTRKKDSTQLRKIKDKLSQANIISSEDFYTYENHIRDTALEPLTEVNLSPDDVYDISSSLGVIGFSKDSLITSLKIETDGSPINIVQYFNNFQYKKKRFSGLVDSMFNNDCQIHSSNEYFRIKAFGEYVSLLLSWNHSDFVLSSSRTIPISSIVYYRVTGNKQFVSDVHGGGANLGGAVVGGALAGNAGAVVGSKVGTEIETTIEEKDGRKLYIYINDHGNIISEEVITEHIDEVLDVFHKRMPQKDYEYVSVSGNQKLNSFSAIRLYKPLDKVPDVSVQETQPDNSNQEQKRKKDITNSPELREYKELLDMGVITRDEYIEKARQLLH